MIEDKRSVNIYRVSSKIKVKASLYTTVVVVFCEVTTKVPPPLPLYFNE